MRNALLLSMLSPALLVAAEHWVFLKDGRVGRGDLTRTPLCIILPDRTTLGISVEQIQGQRSLAETDQAVDAMVQEIVRGRNIPEHTQRLQTFNAAAAPRLLSYLQHADSRMRLTALFGLQFCFTLDAEEPVICALKDADLDVRRTAYAALVRNVPEKNLAERLQSFADGPDLFTAALVFETVERHRPDVSLKRIQRILAEPKYRKNVLHRFSHYRDSSLTPATLQFLDSTDKELLRTGVVGLISQLAGEDAARAKVRALLASPDADVRDLAGEYFAWLGEPSDSDALRRALTKESDPHVQASLDGALRVIALRAERGIKSGDSKSEFAALKNEGGTELTLIYGVAEPPEKDAARERLFRLQSILAAPSGSLRDSMTFLSSIPLETAAAKLPPVREFFDPKRKSFGLQLPSTDGPFSGSVHIGDDVSWRKELRSVVAVAPGVVRSVEHVFSWGFIVIVEHKLPNDQSFCSLYAHLSPLLHVRPGDVVKIGQKIGSVGRNQSVENGGYMAHLHFGLHDGPYLSKKGRWISGYISTENWKMGEHGWLEPQLFLKSP